MSKPHLRSKQPKKLQRKKSTKKKYRVRNWHEYNEMLKQRGNIEMWANVKVIKKRWQAKPSGKRGAQEVYSNYAITCTLQLGYVFGQRLRQTEGMVASLFRLMELDCKIPDFSTLSRRGEPPAAELPRSSRERVILALDSTGLKVYGEGEWKVRQHGISKRRTWRKFHVALTPDGEFRAVVATGNGVGDNEVAGKLLDQEPAIIDAFGGDGGYDKRNVYDLCMKRGISDIRIPPRENARIWTHGNSRASPHPRDENLREIRQTSLKRWKERVGYHFRSVAENGIFRFKTIFGDRLNAREFPRQATEMLVKAGALNQMRLLGMPDSYAVV